MQQLSPDLIPAALHQGQMLFQANRLPEAEVLCRSIVTQYPRHPEALHMLGVVVSTSSSVEEGNRLLAESIQNNPDPPAGHLCDLAVTMNALGRYAEAVPLFVKSLELDPGQAHGHGQMGYALQSLGLLPDAIACYRKAVRVDGEYGEGYYCLGTALHRCGRRDEAIDAFRKALLCKVLSPAILNRLGNEFNREGLGEEALACYRQALALTLQANPAGTCRRSSNAVLRRICQGLRGTVLSIGSGSDSDKEGKLYREYFPASDAYFRLDFEDGYCPDIVGDIQDVRGVVAEQSYDVAFSIWALEHVPDVRAAVGEIHRLLKPRGLFVFGVPLNQAFHGFPHDYHRFALDGIVELFQSRFALIEVYKVGADLPLALDPRLTLHGEGWPSAPEGHVGLARKV